MRSNIFRLSFLLSKCKNLNGNRGKEGEVVGTWECAVVPQDGGGAAQLQTVPGGTVQELDASSRILYQVAFNTRS